MRRDRVTRRVLYLICFLWGCGEQSNPTDASPPDGGSGICAPLPNPGVCGSGDCQAWAQSLVTTGFAHSSCGTATFCQMGDQCALDNTGHVRCTCGNSFNACAPGEVCVSDTPNGPTICRKACVPLCGTTCGTDPCICQTTTGDDVCTARGLVCPITTGLSTCKPTCDGG